MTFSLLPFDDEANEDSKSSRDLRKILYLFIALAMIGLLAAFFHVPSWSARATAALWSLACVACGGAVGFLFGIPKILQNDSTAKLAVTAETAYRQQVNTNLEQISDWLTKIIVGLGLINLKSVPPYLRDVAAILAAGIGSVEADIAFALALIPYFLTIGFLFGYLATRLFLAGAFYRADQAAAVEAFQRKARTFGPDLFKQVVLQTPPETFIKGGESAKQRSRGEVGRAASAIVDEGAGEDEDEQAELTQALDEWRKKEQ